MRKSKLVLVLLVALVVFTTLFILIWRYWRQVPTTKAWEAHVITLAGNGSPAFSENSSPREAGFSDPFGVAIGPDGSVYISDAGDSNRIRKITPEGSLSTFAGGTGEGAADGAGPAASFNGPSGLAIDAAGNVYIADTANNRIRKVSPDGSVSTIAGNATAGYSDGAASSSQFDGPLGVAVDKQGNVFVADTYNDRIRKISIDGNVTTIAGAAGPGYADGEATSALFDTPSSVVVAANGTLIVADTGNDRLRKITPDGKVTTLPVVFADDRSSSDLHRPVGLAITHDEFLYVTEQQGGSVIQVAPDGAASVIAGGQSGYADGSNNARFNQPAGIAVDPRNGDLVVADGANYLVRKLSIKQPNTLAAPVAVAPQLTTQTLLQHNLLWPLAPQDRPHEVVATIGEVRGAYDSTDSRDHLHSGLDVFGGYGEVVRAIRSESVTSPMPNWAFGSLPEGLRTGVVSYIHMHVGRDKDGKVFDDPRFIPVKDRDGKLVRMRVRRGTRFKPGEALGTINRMYHVHLIVGPPGAEVNPLSLSPVGFTDTIAPTIEKDGIQLFDESGKRLTNMESGRLLVQGKLSIVVEAFDRTNMNSDRRRLGLYRVGYQILKRTMEPAAGFNEPRINIVFNRLPASNEATKLVYAAESGITVYGSKTTRFLYQVTNMTRDGNAAAGVWDTSELPAGDYILRIIAADYNGNEAQEDRDLLISIR